MALKFVAKFFSKVFKFKQCVAKVTGEKLLKLSCAKTIVQRVFHVLAKN